MQFNISLFNASLILALIFETYSSPLVSPPKLGLASNVYSIDSQSTKPSFRDRDARSMIARASVAAPSSGQHGKVPPKSHIRTPPLPTVIECKAQLKLDKDTSLFYSGPGGYVRKAKTWRSAQPS